MLYRHDKWCHLLGKEGRLVAGVQEPDLCRDCKPAFLSPYSRSRSAFNGSKIYEEFSRSDNARDFDISRSFPRALLARHSQLNFVHQWVNDSKLCAAFCNVDVPTLKSFVNAAPGSGQLVIRRCLRERKLGKLPGWCHATGRTSSSRPG